MLTVWYLIGAKLVSSRHIPDNYDLKYVQRDIKSNTELSNTLLYVTLTITFPFFVLSMKKQLLWIRIFQIINFYFQ